jgi:hypothetical protein
MGQTATTAQYGSLPFKEAIDFFQQKLNLPTQTWQDIWQGAHSKAFVVAGAMKHDLLVDLRKAVDASISDGKSLTWFKKEFDNIATKHGWKYNGEASWRAKVIYQTNMLQAQNAGRYKQLQGFEFWQYKHGDSLSPREHHLAWNNTILPKDDPWWDIHFPQNGWGCRCRVTGLRENTMQRRGLNVTERPNDGTREWLNKATGEIQQIPQGIDAGFDYSVGQAHIGKQLSDKQMSEYKTQGAKTWQSLTQGNYQSLGLTDKLPKIKTNTPLAPSAQSAKELMATTMAIFGQEIIVPGPTKYLSVYVNSASLVEHIGNDLQRSRFIPLLPEVINNPQEVWASFEKHQGTGKVALRLRYIKQIDMGKGKNLLLVAQVVKGLIEAWTFIPTNSLGYINNQRRGILLYSE